LANGILLGDHLAGMRLTEPFLYLREKAESFNGIFERRIVWQPLNSLRIFCLAV